MDKPIIKPFTRFIPVDKSRPVRWWELKIALEKIAELESRLDKLEAEHE